MQVMAALQPSPWTELHLVPSRCGCKRPRVSSPSRRCNLAPSATLIVNVRHVSFLSFTPALGRRIQQKASSPRTSMQFVSSHPLRKLNPQQGYHKLLAKEQRIFGGGYYITKWSMSVPSGTSSISRTYCRRSPIARFRDKFDKGLRKIGRRRPKLEEQIQKGVEKLGLEKQYGELPQWSAYVPLVAGGLEAAVIIFWTVFLKGDFRGNNMFHLSGEGILTLLLWTNFGVGWLASQLSTWRVQALAPSLQGRDKSTKAARPGIVDFARSFFVNMIPYGNFLAWTRFAWKESNRVSSLNALVYVVPSLVRLVFWSRGFAIGRVELLGWVLGSIHRPYDAARVRNETVLAAAEARTENARMAKEEKENQENGRGLTAEEMALLQQRKELEEFDILLARSSNSTTIIPGPPQEWSVGDTVQWLTREGFARYASTFTDNDIDGAVLLLLTGDDLRDELGIQSLGDRKRLVQALQRLNDSTG